MKFIPYVKQSISAEDIEEVSKSLSEDLITRGPRVEAFEQAVAAYCGASFGVAFNSGTAALMASCHAAKITASDRLISTPNTFVSTVGAAVQCQAKPVFVDIERETGNIDLEQLDSYLQAFQSTRGRPIVAPVHFAGIPIDMQRVDQMLCHPDAMVIEDAAHALGSSYSNGQKVGSCAWSQMTIFSFHPNKNITTGEGGMVMTNDEELCHRLRLYRNNGIERDPKYLQKAPQPWYYEVKDFTGNYNFTEIQAALGLSQLKRLDQFIDKRRRLVLHYRQKLANVPHLKWLSSKDDARTAYHLFPVQIDFAAYHRTRQEVMIKLKDKGIGTQVHYIPLYRHPVFGEAEEVKECFPEMEAYYAQALSLPLYYDLTFEDVDYVCEKLRETLEGKS